MAAHQDDRKNKGASAPVHEIVSGEQVDRFDVGELLHEGGMARIYRVTHPRHALPMVMKVPKLGPQSPVSAYVTFESELRILERLKGAHVPRLIAAGDLAKSPYLVMEYLEGDDLAQAAREAPVDIARIQTLGTRLCKAVHELHRQNVVHLDLNPRNVRNRASGECVLVDFGLAHHAAIPDMIDASFGEEEGTTPYISPEQVLHIRSESRSDVFAIGAMLYLLATGHYPYGRPNLLSLRRRLFQAPPPPRFHNPKVPSWLQEIILRCLEIHPQDRYATPKQVGYLLSHPDAVHLTRRAHRRQPIGLPTRARLWLRSLYQAFDDIVPMRPQERLASAPHVLVALDLQHASEPLKDVLRAAVRKFARSEPHSHFTCLVVLPQSEVSAAGDADEAANAASVVRLAEMRNWAQPLHLPPERIFFHLAVGDPGGTIVDYASHHAIDYVILGARASSAIRRYLGSVSAKVVAEAPCSVTVVRSRRDTG